MAPKPQGDAAPDLAKLSLKTTELETTSTTPKARATPPKKSSPVADSWEDEADDDAEDTPIAAIPSHAGTSAPPPTPMSPVAAASSTTKRPFFPSALATAPGFSIPPFDGAGAGDDHSPSSSSSSQPSGAGAGPSRRPEKTDAVARRMIASALGMRAPRLTEEQKAYDRAVREKERKRREEEKEQERKREEEAVKARQAIWDD